MGLTFEKSRVSEYFDFITAITFPISFIEVAPEDFTTSSHILLVSLSSSCLGKKVLITSISLVSLSKSSNLPAFL